ncbi:MAG: selenide, water dikinase SelD [Tissierellia bacterium]|nr:selenide, water dikinase SelD [Tissierellia bacterium]
MNQGISQEGPNYSMELEVCGGCNAKLGAGDLSEILGKMEVFPRPEIVTGFEGSEDAAVFAMGEEAVLTTVDFFPPMVEDPFIFGAVAAANALSDIYAMNGTPITAMELVLFPQEGDLQQLEAIMAGAFHICKEAEVAITGGHSIHDPKIKFGLSVTGRAKISELIRNNTPQVGDVLFLTKPLGVSLVLSAHQVGEARDEDVEKVLTSMTTLNKRALEILRPFEPHALTDVTGFGLLGHLSEMVADYSATVHMSSIVSFPGAREAAENFLFTAGGQRNRNHFGPRVAFQGVDFASEELLFDPQTSGGLLAAVAPEHQDAAIEALAAANIPYSVVGTVGERPASDRHPLITVQA